MEAQMTKKAIYQVEDAETGNCIIELFDTEEEARREIDRQYAEDKKNNEYVPNYYAVRNLTTGEVSIY